MKNAQIKSYFASHPKEVTELHFASDGVPFFEPGKAQDYANTLEDKNVRKVTRVEADAMTDDNAEPKAYADMKAPELKALCKQRGLDFVGNPKNAELIALLEAKDAEESEEQE